MYASSVTPSLFGKIFLREFNCVLSPPFKKNLRSFSIVSTFSPFAASSCLTDSVPNFSSLSRVRRIVLVCSSGTPAACVSPLRTLMLLILKKTGTLSLLKTSLPKLSNSTSERRLLLPTTSASHWMNCLYLPSLMGPSLKTSPIWKRLKGILICGFMPT